MAKKYKRSSLVLGQVAQPATTPTLAGFYKNVAAGQRGAVEDIGEDVEKKTKGLTGELGLTETEDKDTGKISTGIGDDSKFRVAVDSGDKSISGGPQPTSTTPTATSEAPGFTLSTTKAVAIPKKDDYADNPQGWLDAVNKALTDLGSNIQEWKNSGKEAEDFLNELLKKNREAAQESIKNVNERMTVGNLGKRREQSEIEKQAQDYQNIIANEPGTSNIKALANLSKFYDMSRYGALESGLRQGELALSRQDMIREKEAMGTAESARSAAVRDYGEQSKRLTGELETGLTTQEEEERKKLADYYKTGEEELTGQETTLEQDKTSAEKAVVAKAREPLSKAVADLDEKISTVDKRLSITPQSIDDLKVNLPNFENDMAYLKDSFKHEYSYIGDILEAVMEGNEQKAYDAALNRTNLNRVSKQVADQIAKMFETRNLDNLILAISKILDIDRKENGDNKGVSSAKWASGRLFSWRDEKEKEAREEKSKLESERDNANEKLAVFDANNREYL